MKTFEIIAGTYEEFLLGYDFFHKEKRLVQSFASHDHTASVRCVAASAHFVASGAADDRIILYDFKHRKEHFMLSHHDSTINCLEFTPNHSHLVSGSQNGMLSVTRVGNWQVEKLWGKAHKGSAILDVAVHQSSKLALSLGEDCVLRTWNLVKGRPAYAINLRSKSKDAKSLCKIAWAADGVRFLLFGGKYTEIWSIESGGVVQVIEHDVKVSSCIWYDDKKLLVGYEDGNLCLLTLSKLKKKVYKAHKDRIKALVSYDEWIISGSSGGEIKVYDKDLQEICKINSDCRLTSLVILQPITLKKEEPKENNNDDVVSIEEEDEEEEDAVEGEEEEDEEEENAEENEEVEDAEEGEEEEDEEEENVEENEEVEDAEEDEEEEVQPKRKRRKKKSKSE